MWVKSNEIRVWKCEQSRLLLTSFRWTRCIRAEASAIKKNLMVQRNWDTTGEGKSPHQREYVNHSNRERAVSDPPFNSASEFLWGRLRVSSATETFPFPCIPTFLRELKEKNESRRDVSSLPRVMKRLKRQTGRIQRCHVSGIKWDQVFLQLFSLLRNNSCSFSLFILFPSSLQHWETFLKTGACSEIKQTHN